MQDHDDKRLEALLRERQVPETPGGLAERIILAAAERISVLPWWRRMQGDIMGMLVLQHPAAVLASCVAVGLLIGAEAAGLADTQSVDWTSFLYIDEGDWL